MYMQHGCRHCIVYIANGQMCLVESEVYLDQDVNFIKDVFMLMCMQHIRANYRLSPEVSYF